MLGRSGRLPATKRKVNGAIAGPGRIGELKAELEARLRRFQELHGGRRRPTPTTRSRQ